jgi:hypothetical protein
MDPEITNTIQFLYRQWNEKEQLGTLRITREDATWTSDDQTITICVAEEPMQQFLAGLHAKTTYERLVAHYELGARLRSRPWCRTKYRQRTSRNTIRAADRTYEFFSRCGPHRIGQNPTITATKLARYSEKKFEELIEEERIASLFAGAQLPEGNNLLADFPDM